MDEEIVMYIIVNSDVKMSVGKTAAQVGHAAVCAYRAGLMADEAATEQWISGSYTKIILKASREEMVNLIRKYPFLQAHVLDEGRTEISQGTLTAVAFIPMRKDKKPEELKLFKLL